jgi:3-dehydroquinate synthase
MTVIKSAGYPVIINKNIAKEINGFFKSKKDLYSKIFILVDENSLNFCYPSLVAKLPVFKDAEIIEIESGEESKNIDVCSQIWSTLSEFGGDRNSLMVNLGGGVISDLGGFIASTFKRGIDFINIPTTLLAQVDASIGGKTGIDHDNLKNEIGVFAAPKAVFINSAFLQTLDKRQFLSGFAEIIKHALIADVKYWKKLQSYKFSNEKTLDEIINTSVNIKNKIVIQDPHEKNIRKTLNFGHTIGHALESFFLEYQGKQLLHGEAIAIGMICEAYLSHKICKLPKVQFEEISKFILHKYKYIKIDGINETQLLELMMHDKKNSNEKINFSLLSSIGKCEINKSAKPDLIIESLNYYLKEIKTLDK